MIHASLCTGIGACELAATWMGWENAFSCEIDEFCNKVLSYHYPNTKHYGNIFKQDFREWRGRIDVLTAGFPCQPFSVAGQRNGAEDHRYLWNEVFRVINEVRPTWFIGENVAGILSMVLSGEETKVGSYTDVCGESYSMYEKRQRYVIDQIRLDLESIGYTIKPVVIPACAVGAPHRRDRVWFLARKNDTPNPDSTGLQTQGTEQQATRIAGSGLQWDTTAPDDKRSEELDAPGIANWQNFPTQSPVCNGNDGFPGELPGITFSRWRQASIKALGNSMVPQVVYEIFLAIEQVEETLTKKTI